MSKSFRRNPNSKLTIPQVLEIKAAAKRGENQMEIAHKYGTTQTNVSSIHLGLTWKRIEQCAAE